MGCAQALLNQGCIVADCAANVASNTGTGRTEILTLEDNLAAQDGAVAALLLRDGVLHQQHWHAGVLGDAAQGLRGDDDPPHRHRGSHRLVLPPQVLPPTTFLNSLPRSTQCSYMRKIPAAEQHARANALKRAGLSNWDVDAGVNAIPACRVNADTLQLIRWAGSGGGV